MFAASIQGEGVLTKSQSQSGPGTMQAWFPTGEPICGCGSCVPDLAFYWPSRVGAGLHSHAMRKGLLYSYICQCCKVLVLRSFLLLNNIPLYGYTTKISYYYYLYLIFSLQKSWIVGTCKLREYTTHFVKNTWITEPQKKIEWLVSGEPYGWQMSITPSRENTAHYPSLQALYLQNSTCQRRWWAGATVKDE